MKEIIKKKWFSFPLWDVYFSAKEQFYLFLLILVGMILRVINAIHTPFWRDEIYIFYTAHTNTLWQLITQQHWDTAHPPLHSIFLHFWQLISIEPFWQRIPSLITSLFILYHVPILAIKIFKKQRIFPFVFLFLFAISNTQISLNMVSRPYPFVSLLSIMSLIHILELYEKKTISFKETRVFLIVNSLGFYIDYSFIWLFFAYLFALIIQFFRDKKKRAVIITLIQSLIGTGIILIPAFIMLFTHLPQSLKLESQSSIKFEADPHTNTLEGLPLSFSLYYVGAPRLTINSSRRLFDEEVPWALPFFNDVHYLGFDIPPLSGIIVNELTYCSSKTPHTCASYRDFISQLGKSKIKSILVKQIGSSIFLFNAHPKEWRSYLFPVTSESSLLNHSIRTSFFVIGRNAQIIFASAQGKGIEYMDKSRISAVIKMESRNFLYEALVSNPQENLEVRFLKSISFMDKFGGDMLFFSGLPSHTNDIYAWISLILLLISFGAILKQLKDRPTLGSILSLSLVLTPIILSMCLSVVIAPIFVARNLYISSFAYLIGMSLFITYLLMGDKLKRSLGLFLLVVFIYMLSVKYPFLHYVDPPYGVDRMIYKVLSGDKQKKKIIVIDNSSHYEPLLYYALLMANYKGNGVAVVTLSSFKHIVSSLTIDSEQKNNYEYYFIRFNQDINNFKDIASILDCKIDDVKMTYAFFAHCHH